MSAAEQPAQLRQSFVRQRGEPEGDPGVAGSQRHFHHIQHLYPP